MKRSLILACVLASFAGTQVAADTIAGVYAGAQGWRSGVAGGFSNDSTITNFNFDDKTNSSFYVALEHPLPLVPNIKLARTTLNSTGDTTLSTDFSYGDRLFTAQSQITTDVDFTSTDVILYYEVLDNDLVSIDLGLTGKYLDGTILVVEPASNTTGSQDLSVVVPLLYSRVALGLPFTGWGVYAEGNYLAVGSNSLSDYQVAVTYSFIESLALDLTLQVGYRDFSVDIEDVDDTFADIGFDGVFAGVELHF